MNIDEGSELVIALDEERSFGPAQNQSTLGCWMLIAAAT